VFFTEPFELTGRGNVEVKAGAGLDNTWLWLGVDLVDETAGQLRSIEIPLEYYSGGVGSDQWSEGSRSRTMFLSAPKKGPYVLRVESHWESGKPAPAGLRIRVREGVFRLLHFLLALIAISILPLWAILRRASFESRRWQESSYSPLGQPTGDDEEDEE
jgi:hypothetical protein